VDVDARCAAARHLSQRDRVETLLVSARFLGFEAAARHLSQRDRFEAAARHLSQREEG
jgi:hypothetical protein